MIFVEFENFLQKFRRHFWSKNPMFIKKCRHKNEKMFNFFESLELALYIQIAQ